MSYIEAILDRDDETCQFCGRRNSLHVHHIEYRSAGGGDEHTNLLTLCFACHRDRAHGIKWQKYQELFKSIIKDKYDNT